MGIEGINIGLVLVAGFASFASPCVLPLVPSFLGIIAGSHGAGEGASRFHGLAATSWFVLGFTAVFSILGIAFAGVALLFSGASQIIQIISGILILILAANLVFDFLPFLNYEKRFQVEAGRRPVIGPFVTGVAFGAGWSPCIGPILASILAYAGSSGDIGVSLLYLLVYGVGLGLPFVILSLGLETFKPMLAFLKRHHRAVKLVSASIMAVMGLLVLFGQGTFFARKLPELGYFLQRWAQDFPVEARIWGLLGIFFVILVPALIRLLIQLRRKEAARPVPAAVFLGLGTLLVVAEAAGLLGGGVVTVVAGWFQMQGL